MDRNLHVFSAGSLGRAVRSADALAGCVGGVTPRYRRLHGGEQLLLRPDGCFHMLFLVEGEAVVNTGGGAVLLGSRATVVPSPDAPLMLTADADAELLELRMEIGGDMPAWLSVYRTAFPILRPYAEAKRYDEDCKSLKTVNRLLIEPRVIPHFSMGSVETDGPDAVQAHRHESIDQFFFTLPGCDMEVLLDGVPVRLRDRMLLFIPHGTSHGVRVADGAHLHYLWLDLYAREENTAILDRDHRLRI